MPSDHTAPVAVPVLDAIQRRWSPRAFSDAPVTDGQLQQVLEAARWAASSRNEQPWRFLVARKGEAGYESLLACLNEKNQRWAQHAPVLMLVFARRTFSHNDAPNRHAWHDVGAACAQLAVQASHLGLQAHLMAGLERDTIAETYDVPDVFAVVTALALGVPGPPESLPESLQARETAIRTRKPQPDSVFGAAWGTPLRLTDG